MGYISVLADSPADTFFVYIHSHSNSEQKHPQNSSTRNPVKRHRAAAGTCRPHHRRPHRRRRDNRRGFGGRNDVQPHILELRISAHGDKRTDSAGIRRARQATDVGDAVSLSGTGTAARHRHRGTAVAHKMAAARRHLPKRGSPHPRLAIFLHHNLGRAATLATMSLTGWFIGMQNSTYPLAVSMVVNVVNIVCSLCFVFAMRLGFIGIPLGTLAAQWCGFILSAFFAARMMRKETLGYAPRIEEMLRGLGRFFQRQPRHLPTQPVRNGSDAVFTATGARSGNMTLAVNALFMQLYLLYSHFMDGFAYAGEALVGKYAAPPTSIRCDAACRISLHGDGVSPQYSLSPMASSTTK